MKIQNNWLFEPTINYYINTKNINIEKSIRYEVNQNVDFIYEFQEYEFDSTKYEIIKSYEDIKTMLLMKKGKFKP